MRGSARGSGTGDILGAGLAPAKLLAILSEGVPTRVTSRELSKFFKIALIALSGDGPCWGWGCTEPCIVLVLFTLELCEGVTLGFCEFEGIELFV